MSRMPDQAQALLCVTCTTGHMLPGHTSMTLTRDQTTIVVEQVPSELCDNCGEAYISGDVAKALEAIVEQAVSAGLRYAVRDYAQKVA